MQKKNSKKNDFENTLNELEQIVARLENDNLPLEQALSEFEKGINLAKEGQQRLQQAEQKVKILLDKSAVTELEDYHHVSEDNTVN